MNRIRHFDVWLVFVAGALICTSFIWLYPIYILDEARNSEAAREMLVSGNFVVPFFNGQLRTDKPPLHYFFMILGYKLFGVNAFGARFFSGIFGALTFVIAYINTKRWMGFQVAKLTVVILMSSLFFVQEFHLAVPDPYLIFFVGLSLFAFFNSYKSASRYWLFVFYLAIALGILTKGPIALVLPGMIVPVFLWFKQDFSLRSILKLRPFLGLLLILLIAGPWYYLVHVQTNGEWTNGFFFEHNLSRFGSGMEGHGGLFIVTPLFVVLGLLPFSVFIFQGFVHAWRVRKENDFMLFSFLVATVTIVFFSIASTKLPNYPMPSYPFVAVLIAVYLDMFSRQNKKNKSVTWSMIILLIIGIVLPVGGWIGLTVEKQLVSVRNVSMVLLVASSVGMVGFYFYKQRKFNKAFISIAGGWVLMGIAVFGYVYPKLTEYSPVAMAMQQLPTKAKIVAYKRFDSAFPINLKRTLPVVQSLEELNNFLKGNSEVYIITNTRDEQDLKQLEGLHLILQQKALFENHTTRVYTK